MKTFTFCSIFCFCCLYGLAQNNKSTDQERFDSLNEIHKRELFKASEDTVLQRAHTLIYYIDQNKELDSASIKFKKHYLKHIMKAHFDMHEKDSVIFYFENLIKNYTEYPGFLSSVYLQKGVFDFLDGRIEESLINYDKALHSAEASGNWKKVKNVLFNFSALYRFSERDDLAQEVLDQIKLILKDKENIRDQFQLDYEYASIWVKNKKSEEAIDKLKKYDTSKLVNKNRLWFRNYHLLLSQAYQKLKDYDSAFYHLNLAAKDSKSAPFLNPIQKQLYYASLLYEKEKYKKALEKLNLITDTTRARNVEPAVLDYRKLGYQIHDKLGNTEQALFNLKEYHKIKANIDENFAKAQAGILRYKISRDKEVKRMAYENEQQELTQQEKQKRLTYTYLIIILVLAIIGILIVMILKRKQHKAELDLKIKTEIADLKNEYVENITHEFKTPLSVNLGYLELMKSNALKPNKVVEYIDISKNINQRLISAVESLLLHIKHQYTDWIDIDRPTEEKLLEFLTSEIKNYEYHCIKNDLEIVFKTNVDAGFVLSFDYSKLEKVIDNLLDNAIKFSSQGGKIYFTFLVTPQAIHLQVKDKGVGIAQEKQEMIFERFYQSSPSGEKTNNGFGIGLYLIESIVKSWNGTLEVESEVGEGATFTAAIPLDNFSISQDLFVEKEEVFFSGLLEKEENTNNVVKILIVENQLDMINYLSHILATDYYCDFAYNGQVAYELIEENTYDLIISDYQMPVMDGLALKSLLEKDEHYSQIPFILISASDIRQGVEKYAEDENFVFFKKPFTEVDLKAQIESYIGDKINQYKIINTANANIETTENEINTFLSKVNLFIRENIINDALKVEDVAKHMGYSQTYFFRTIKAYTHLNPVHIIQEIRLLKAYELIKEGNHKTISEIIAKVGINSRAHFYKIFEKRFNIKPGKMFKACRKEMT